MPFGNSHNSSRRGIPQPVSPVQPPSSVYSQQSQRFIPVSPPSSVSVTGASAQGRPPMAAGSARTRPSSSAFFNGTAAPQTQPANGYPGNNPFAYNSRPGSQMGGYDGAYDTFPIPSPAPPQMPPYPTSQLGSLFPDINDNNNHNQKKTKADKPRPKPKTKSTKNHALKTDLSGLSTIDKLGLFMMGTTREKLENAAQAQQLKKLRDKEKKKERRAARREQKRQAGTGGAGGAGSDVGLGDADARDGYSGDDGEVEENEW
ncbi:hypothetical protein N658DRAFT_554722 [Parathielavia hyrcaniae]|uniref:Uncharacterized protein n=1 Tax=Parathielavia hyrcaniae TaxID=113614 RepID=A0AAN6PQX8_9PEZI|nr:hypothetical protein N658DRAFT_554722 [Parathielavia hyrcaniae]